MLKKFKHDLCLHVATITLLLPWLPIKCLEYVENSSNHIVVCHSSVKRIIIMIAYVAHFFLLSLAFVSSSLAQPDHGGFSVELIHRDSPKSPFFNPSKTPSQRLADAVTRSNNRVNRFKLALISTKSPQAPVRSDDGQYIMKFSLGTPPTEVIAFLDTGSDLTWTQCEPCWDCKYQKGPIYNSSASSTYKVVRCNTPECRAVPYSRCDRRDICTYSITYMSGLFTIGDVAMETIILGSTSGKSISFDKTIWGCGHDNQDPADGDQAGLVGLGASPASLIIQKGSELGGQKFSYCLAPSEHSNSTLSFGKAGVVSGPGVVSTPLIISEPFYKITLEAISVGNERFELKKELSTKGNIIVDSGTTFTFLPEDIYNPIKSAVEKAINLKPAPSFEDFLDCYYNNTVFEAPIITMHFDGADMKLKTLNTFLQDSKNTTCLAFLPTEDDAIFGTIAQMNFLVGYDLEATTFSFKTTDCSKK